MLHRQFCWIDLVLNSLLEHMGSAFMDFCVQYFYSITFWSVTATHVFYFVRSFFIYWQKFRQVQEH